MAVPCISEKLYWECFTPALFIPDISDTAVKKLLSRMILRNGRERATNFCLA